MSNKLLIRGVVIVVGGLLIWGGLSNNGASPSGTASIQNSVSTGSNAHPAPDFTLQKLGGRGINFPIALDSSGSASRVFGIQYTNTHFLIDINGNLVRTIPGDISESDIESLVNSQAVSESDQSSATDEKPCKVALADGRKEAGVCKNENL